jgi:hypothetical protein
VVFSAWARSPHIPLLPLDTSPAAKATVSQYSILRINRGSLASPAIGNHSRYASTIAGTVCPVAGTGGASVVRWLARAIMWCSPDLSRVCQEIIKPKSQLSPLGCGASAVRATMGWGQLRLSLSNAWAAAQCIHLGHLHVH